MYLEFGVVKNVYEPLVSQASSEGLQHTDPEYPRSPTAIRSVRLLLLGLRKLSVYSSSSICHIWFRSFLNTLARYLDRARLKMAKKAAMRANSPGRGSSSVGDDAELKIARRIEVLMRRSRRPML
jgi:hypothetical protein